VQILRVNGNKNEYKGVKKSALFDNKLKMYRLNAPLKDEPLEIGRSRIFVPGWLENETVWLHMEYKYLLEILKSGLYREFFEDLKNCCICYFDPKTYGRNILENSSFIVSIVYPDKDLWGKGFVARLSGATVELLNMWMLMCFGHEPFSLDKDGNLALRFAPILKGDMFTTSKKELVVKGKKVTLPANTFSFKLFSSTLVVYHNPSRKDTFAKGAKVEKITLKLGNKTFSFQSDTVSGPMASAIRNQEIARIDVYFKK
jgi:hypothetical protein